jgi:hypothetical protein
MRNLANSALMVLLGLIVIASVGAETRRGPTVRPTTGPGSDEFTVEVVEISGLAEVRSDTYSKWQKPVVGNRLGEGAQIRIGPRSFVKVRTSSGKSLTIDRLGTFGVQREMDEGKIPGYKPPVFRPMRYDRSDIAGSEIEHVSIIHSPSTTLAIRGHKVTVFSDDHDTDSKFPSPLLLSIEQMIRITFHLPL